MPIFDCRLPIAGCRLTAEDVAIPVFQSALSPPRRVNHRSPIANQNLVFGCTYAALGNCPDQVCSRRTLRCLKVYPARGKKPCQETQGCLLGHWWFCLNRTINIALQPVDQTHSSKMGHVLKYATISVQVLGHVWPEIGRNMTPCLTVYLSWLESHS